MLPIKEMARNIVSDYARRDANSGLRINRRQLLADISNSRAELTCFVRSEFIPGEQVPIGCQHRSTASGICNNRGLSGVLESVYILSRENARALQIPCMCV